MSDTYTVLAPASTDTITLSSVGAVGGNTDWMRASITNTGAVGGTAYAGPYTINTSNVTGVANPWFTHSNAAPKINLDGEGADIVINGESLISMLHRIEERLNILTPNPKLETEWAELQALGEQYRKLEQHILDKQATWDRLKAMPAPDID
jgi:hypothetical protein